LQGFHNAHMHMNEASGTPEWYDLAASGLPMNGIPLESPMFKLSNPDPGMGLLG
jgi:hypothetical protein